MPKFNPLDHPVCFSSPLRHGPTWWSGYVSFAMTLVDLLRPQVIVELGTMDGVSYCAFCQVVRELRLPTRCYAVTQRRGEDRSEDSETLASLKEHHDPLYGNFSQLIESSCEDAQGRFADGEIDLLHIRGGHRYPAAKQLFESWLPKMSSRGVVILSETNLHKREHEVWKLWEDIKLRYPHFELGNDGGMAAFSVGAIVPEQFRQLTEMREPGLSLVREFFHQQGLRLGVPGTGREAQGTDRAIDDDEGPRTLPPAALETGMNELEQEREVLNSVTRDLQLARQEVVTRTKRLRVVQEELDIRSSELGATASQLNAIVNSRAWRWVTRYGLVKNFIVRATSRVFPSVLSNEKRERRPAEIFAKWAKEYDDLTDSDREAIFRRIQGLSYKPLISIVMPVYNPQEKWLRRAIESVLWQLYPNWELCISDDCSSQAHVRRVLEEFAQKDSRIKVTFRRERGHISLASNSALELVSGEFIAFLDHDDELAEHALYMVAEELREHPEADLIYSDEDKINKRGERCHPHFKTDWNHDLFCSMNFVSHLGVYRASIVMKVGGLRPGYEGSQDYDLAWRVIERVPADHIRHIPHILYHWRAVPGSAALARDEKHYAHEAAREAIRSHFERSGSPVTVTAGYRNYHRVVYPLPVPAPLVSLIIGTRDRVGLLRQIVTGALDETRYEPLELIIVDNQSEEPATLSYLSELRENPRVTVVNYDAPFNFSAINNLGVSKAKGEIIGLVNNDIKIISPDWLSEMVSHAIRPEIGAVGAKLYYPDDTIQHAGVIIGLGGVAGHAHKHLRRRDIGYVCRPHVIQNFSAVTAACVIMRREVFNEVGGFNEADLPIAFNDVDFCLRIRERGYRILWTPYAEMYHLESASRGSDDIPEQLARFRGECAYIKSVWGDQLFHDPYYNPNLSLDTEDFSLADPPRGSKPWQDSG